MPDELNRYHFPRIPHCPWSEKKTSDDKTLDSVSHFEGRVVTITEKYDGENFSIYSDGYVHARSVEHSRHPSRTYLFSKAGQLAGRIPHGWRICGENLQAQHTIRYDDLKDWVIVFGIFDEHNKALNWDELKMVCRELELVHAPLLFNDSKYENMLFNEKEIRSIVVPKTVEGYVVRDAVTNFHYSEYKHYVFKMVAKHFEIPPEHWTRMKIKHNGLKKNEDI